MGANSVVKSVFKKSGTSISASVSGDKLVHEAGGIEADISAVAKGDILAGSGTGAIGIIAASGKSDGDVLTLQADGTVDYEAAGGGGAGVSGDGLFMVQIDDNWSSVAHATWVKAFDDDENIRWAERIDDDNLLADGVYTPPAGKYYLHAQMATWNQDEETAGVRIQKDGGTIMQTLSRAAGDASTISVAADIIVETDGNYAFTADFYHEGGAPQAINATTSWFGGWRVS